MLQNGLGECACELVECKGEKSAEERTDEEMVAMTNGEEEKEEMTARNEKRNTIL